MPQEQTLKRHLNMNNQSPLVPQGSFLEPKNKGRTRVMIAVFVALSINGIGLMALLMQGCQKPPETPPATQEATNPPPTFAEPTNTNTTVTATNPAPAPAEPAPPVTNAAPPEPTPPPAPPATGTEYSIAKGDTFGKLAKKFHVSVKAIEAANPGVDPAKLKIGQKIQIPAGAGAAAATGAATSAATEPAATGGEQTYTVKSGDNLGKIAKEHGTTVKAIRSANSLKTDRITVGQKLKIPAKASAPAGTTTPTTEPMSGAATGAPPTAPSSH